MDATTILMRFVLGVVLAGGLALWGGVASPWGLALAVVIGVAAAAWGDKFLVGFLAVMRYFR
jgi:hypothetical protein